MSICYYKMTNQLIIIFYPSVYICTFYFTKVCPAETKDPSRCMWVLRVVIVINNNHELPLKYFLEY
jgi:hypothetical protein